MSHDASATGAPNSLLNFLECVRNESVFDYRVLLLKGGLLEEAYSGLGSMLVVDKGRSGPKPFFEKLFSRIFGYRKWFARPDQDTIFISQRNRLNAFLKGFSPDLIYLNSVAAAPVLAYLDNQVPMITYVRELEEYVQKTIATGWFSELVRRTSLFISVSEAAKQNLVVNYGIQPERFKVIPTFVDVAKLDGQNLFEAKKRLHDLTGGNNGATIVVGCGTTDWRKGPDLFMLIAKALFSMDQQSSMKFVWIGGMGSPEERMRIHYDLRQASLVGRVYFLGMQDTSAHLIAGGDVLALTSREDPFPRVMLEAGIARIPTVCFKNSGGAEEFTSKGCGIAADYLDINSFAEAIKTILNDNDLKTRLGVQARKTVIQDHNSTISSRNIINEIKKLSR